VKIPVLGSGDCIEPEQVIERMGTGVSGVLVGRGVLRNPWILAQASDLAAGRPVRAVTLADRGRFVLEYLDLLLQEGANEADGFRHKAAASEVRHERWVINKLRALMSWYSKGLTNGGHLRIAVNSAQSISEARDIVNKFFEIDVVMT